MNRNRTVMKHLSIALNYLVPIALFAITGCNGDDPDPVEERKGLFTSSPWNVSTVSQSSVDISSAFTGATVTFQTNGNYSTTIDQTFSDIWPSSGAWSLPSLDLLVVNGLEMTISSVTESTLSLTFTSPNPAGRTTGIDGDYIMAFTR